MNKNLNFDDFLSIKEFAALVRMTIRTLRYYDEIGIFQPAKRGTGAEDKYRFYSPMQITTVKMIRVLAEIGVPLKTIKELEDYRTPEKLIKILSENKIKINNEIRFLEEISSVIITFLDLLYEGMIAKETEISVSEMPERPIILGAQTDFGSDTTFFREFINFCNATHTPELNMSYPIGGYFTDMNAFINKPSYPSRFFSLDPKGYDKKAAGLYLVGYTRGYYGQTNDLPQRMVTFAKKNELIFCGPVYNIYLSDEISVSDPTQYLLQVSTTVTGTRHMPIRRPNRRF